LAIDPEISQSLSVETAQRPCSRNERLWKIRRGRAAFPRPVALLLNGVLELVNGQVATTMAVEALAAQLAEILVRKRLLSLTDAQGLLVAIAEELRSDGDRNDGKLANPCCRMASKPPRVGAGKATVLLAG
jgi:hypothetical protein